MLRVLGPLEVEGPEGPVPIGGPVSRRILCALLVRPGAVVTVDSLVHAAWGEDPPPSAEQTLISHVTRLREALARVGESRPAAEQIRLEPSHVNRRSAGNTRPPPRNANEREGRVPGQR